MAVTNYVNKARKHIIEAITAMNQAQFIAQENEQIDLAYDVSEHGGALSSWFNKTAVLEGKYKRIIMSPTDTLPAAPPTAACEHEPGEDCMVCQKCRKCSESLDDDDICSECVIEAITQRMGFPIPPVDPSQRVFYLFESVCPECGADTTITDVGGPPKFHKEFQWTGEHTVTIRPEASYGWVEFKCAQGHEHYIEHCHGDWAI